MVIVLDGCSIAIVRDGCTGVGIFGRTNRMDCLALAVWREYDQIIAVFPIELIAACAVCGIEAFIRDGDGA